MIKEINLKYNVFQFLQSLLSIIIIYLLSNSEYSDGIMIGFCIAYILPVVMYFRSKLNIINVFTFSFIPALSLFLFNSWKYFSVIDMLPYSIYSIEIIGYYLIVSFGYLIIFLPTYMLMNKFGAQKW